MLPPARSCWNERLLLKDSLLGSHMYRVVLSVGIARMYLSVLPDWKTGRRDTAFSASFAYTLHRRFQSTRVAEKSREALTTS